MRTAGQVLGTAYREPADPRAAVTAEVLAAAEHLDAACKRALVFEYEYEAGTAGLAEVADRLRSVARHWTPGVEC